MELGTTAHLILGMLRKGPKSGYEIKAKADVSTRFFWAISYGQLYPELKRLEQAGLIAGEEDPSDGRRRRVYTITAEGEAALRAWLTSGGELHVELRHEGLLRLFFADALDDAERTELLAAIRARHRAVGDELRAMEEAVAAYSDETGDELALLTLQSGIAYQEFFVGMCERLERQVAERAGTITGGS